jgi:dTMP kinase
VGGKFITFEGGEGAGKSTLARAIAARLEEAGVDSILTREPGGSAGADEVRELIVRGGTERWKPLSEALLFAAARTDHVARVIRPALDAGRWVLCDRFTDSTRAYQGAGRGLRADTLDALDRLVDAPKPDLTFVLDLDPADGLMRSRGAHAGEDRYERMEADFHARVRAAFLDIARNAPERCVVIDAMLEKDAVLALALDAIADRFGVRAIGNRQ